MKYFIVEYDYNWADEMDLRGFCIMSEKQMELYFAAYKKIFDRDGYYNFCVGTNEEVEYESFNNFKKAFGWQEITAADKKRIEFLFGLQSFIGGDPDIGPTPNDELPKGGLEKFGFFPWDDFAADE